MAYAQTVTLAICDAAYACECTVYTQYDADPHAAVNSVLMLLHILQDMYVCAHKDCIARPLSGYTSFVKAAVYNPFCHTCAAHWDYSICL